MFHILTSNSGCLLMYTDDIEDMAGILLNILILMDVLTCYKSQSSFRGNRSIVNKK